MEVGDAVIVTSGTGHQYEGVLTEVGERFVKVSVQRRGETVEHQVRIEQVRAA